ncbi:MAG TPA: serine hydrolase domain-containing protein [Candidatus Limnocylindrales bacterium]|nr:serine hydrolase domain-containing protein [Candidatus Limnocylindrales bacterium]
MTVRLKLSSRGCSLKLAFTSLLLVAHVVQADKLDDFIVAAMEKRHIAGLSLAVIQDGQIARAQAYGLADRNSKVPVTTNTLFQAGSISKSVAAVGALHLVEKGQLALDDDVNRKLASWKVPENEFTKGQKVTLRRILSHSAGLTVHGFPGYAQGKPVPTLVQVLDGVEPANTRPIRVDLIPGSKFRYSGGGYTVMQQMINERTGKPFPDYMQETVLNPFGMTNSTFEQPLPAGRVPLAAIGYYEETKPVEGGWHIYPEMAAAGLWTTAADLARFAIGLQQARAGRTNGVISQAMTQQMLSEQSEHDGLGLFLEGKGKALRFRHAGRDEGFDAELVAYAETGQGGVVMINANDNRDGIRVVLEAVAHAYHWPDF